MNRKIIYYESIDSTNEAAKRSELFEAVFVAGEQTEGKGSKGRVWQSNKNEGLYLSFLLRPQMKPEKVQGLTIMAAVVACHAIEKHIDVKAQIKWPNDVLVDGRKAAGILTESILSSSGIERVVCGIGINTNQKFEGELAGRAHSLQVHSEEDKDKLRSEIIGSFYSSYDLFTDRGLEAFLDEFRKRNAIKGRLTITSGGKVQQGAFEDIDDTGALIIDTGSGTKRYIAGEVTLRGENGYA